MHQVDHLWRPFGLQFHARTDTVPASSSVQPPELLVTQKQGIVNQFLGDFGKAPDDHLNQDFLGPHCLSLKPRCESHAPQPIVPTDLPCSGWCIPTNSAMHVTLILMTHQHFTLHTCPDTLRAPRSSGYAKSVRSSARPSSQQQAAVLKLALVPVRLIPESPLLVLGITYCTPLWHVITQPRLHCILTDQHLFVEGPPKSPLDPGFQDDSAAFESMGKEPNLHSMQCYLEQYARLCCVACKAYCAHTCR